MKRRAVWAAGVTASALCAGGASVAVAVPTLAPCGPRHFVADRQGPPAVVQAYFLQRSYAPGETARLVVLRAPHGTTVQVFHADVKYAPPRRADAITGVPVSERVPVRRGTAALAIGNWQSGLYFARLVAGSSVGYAPFVVRS